MAKRGPIGGGYDHTYDDTVVSMTAGDKTVTMTGRQFEDAAAAIGGRPPADLVKRLAAEVENAQAEAKDRLDSANDLLKTHAETDGLHVKALKAALKVRNMKDGEREEFIFHRDRYEEILGVHAQADMFRDDEAA